MILKIVRDNVLNAGVTFRAIAPTLRFDISLARAAFGVKLCLLLAVLLVPASLRASTYGAEYDAAFQAMMEEPTDLERTFHFASIARGVGDFEGAVGALERMLIYNPDLPVVHWELARL